MNDFVIYTDSACDIPPELLKEWGVPYSWLTYVFEGDARQYSNYELPFPEFYDKMRKGSVARTSAVNADAFVQGFEPILQDGKDILYIGFSSGLSGTYHTGCIAAQELREKYPERDIRCVDTFGASGGFGLLLYMAVQKKREGGTIEECEKVVLDNRFHLCHWFTVDDLVYLKRGGRISAATAFVGNTLGFKPVLHMDDAGHLINMFKVRGRRASLNAMADKYGELALDKAGGTVFISHGDCRADADTLAAILKERYGASVKDNAHSVSGSNGVKIFADYSELDSANIMARGLLSRIIDTDSSESYPDAIFDSAKAVIVRNDENGDGMSDTRTTNNTDGQLVGLQSGDHGTYELLPSYKTAECDGERGSVALAAFSRVVWDKNDENGTYSCVFCFGTSAFVDPQIPINNSIMNMVFSYLNRNESVSYENIGMKKFDSNGLSVSTSAATAWTVVCVAVIPVLIIGFGTFVWIRRRHS